MGIKELPSTEEILTHVYRTDQVARVALEYVRARQGKAGDPEIVLQNLITACNSLESSFASSGVETFLHRTVLPGTRKRQEEAGIEEYASEPRREAPVAQYKITTNSGWLSPEGKFYHCSWMEHDAVAVAMGGSPQELEAQGWVRISEYEGRVTLQRRGRMLPTLAQIDRLWDRWPRIDPTKLEFEQFDFVLQVGFIHHFK